MRKSLWLLAGMTVVALTQAAGQGLRPAAFAGLFYAADPARLAAEIESYFAAAAPADPPSGKILALIVPHAGYVYSGRTAAAAYALVRDRAIDTVVIIGPSHRVAFEGCSIWPDGGFETPLGVARVDASLAREIAKASGFRFRPEAFAEEHSVEVQVPFIQKALPGAAIVPIVMGRQTSSTIRTMAAALGKTCLAKNVLVVASTDLSHFLPKTEAQATDAATAALIRAVDTEDLIRKTEAGENIMCGGGPVAAVLLLAGKAGQARVEVLARTDSSGFGGPVVGYLAAVVLSGTGPGLAKAGTAGFQHRHCKAGGKPGPGEGDYGAYSLTPEEKTELLRMARASVTASFGRREAIDDASGKAKFLEPRGVFVTLTKGGDLRGCIGFIEPVAPLGRAVIRAAVSAATEDPRFPPVRPAEIRDLKFEISVLTPVREISDPREIVVGKHGLVVSRGEHKGLILPQVPMENKWDRKTFLEQASLKAGLPRDAWRLGAKLYVFEAIVFHE